MEGLVDERTLNLFPNIYVSGSVPQGWAPTRGSIMKESISLQALFSQASDRRQQVASFALLCLGIIESLTSGLLSATDALRLFFHAENCLFVRKNLKEKIADQIMSRGVQLADLFEALPAEAAQREFQREVTTMHSLCVKLLEAK